MDVGSLVVVKGVGAGTVISADDRVISVKTEEGNAQIPTDAAHEMLRAVMDRAEAERLLERICTPVTGEPNLGPVRSIRHVGRMPLETQAEYLRWLYRSKTAFTSKEREVILSASPMLLGELGAALGLSGATVKRRARAGKVDSGTKAKLDLPPPPEHDSFEHHHTFELGAQARVGEAVEYPDACIQLDVVPGAWHAFFSAPDEEYIVWVHHDFVGYLDDPMPDEVAGDVVLEGATIGMLSLSAFDDPDFGSAEEVTHRRDGSAQTLGRYGYETRTGGDGSHNVCVRRARGAVAMVAVRTGH